MCVSKRLDWWGCSLFWRTVLKFLHSYDPPTQVFALLHDYTSSQDYVGVNKLCLIAISQMLLHLPGWVKLYLYDSVRHME